MTLQDKQFYLNNLGDVRQVIEQDYSFRDKQGVTYFPDGACMLWGKNDFDLIKRVNVDELSIVENVVKTEFESRNSSEGKVFSSTKDSDSVLLNSLRNYFEDTFYKHHG